MGKERRMSQESEYKKLDEEKARLHEENEQYRRQLKNRFGSDDGFRIQYEELEQEYNIILEENRSLNRHANNKIMPLGVGSESTEDTLHQHHPPPPPIKVPTATTTYDPACVSTALRETYNLDSFAQYIANALQGSCVFDYWTAELLDLPEYRGDIENIICENHERYGWLVMMTKSDDGVEGGEKVTWIVDEERVEMALEDMEDREDMEGIVGIIGGGEEKEAGELVQRSFFVGKRNI